ncbi:hypothetical protein C7L42_03770 [Campylobacter coli]|nr:hypothetical protein [Campylobacter coli]ECQ7497633.1 hypothetical protein [Campylobacter jejuni]EDB7409395.1 hypothetical protein [Campylobacter jejuni]EJJ3217444.1 hypothetical protein [Campylobacter jejuni]EKL1189108.1 hypothetical protein [Campylobacter jejuni]
MKLKDFDFRIWDNIEKKYIKSPHGLYIENTERNDASNCNRIIANYEQRAFYIDYPFNDRNNEYYDNEECFEIELFTGYYDYKGNKIYIGDIIECLVSTNEKNSEIFYEIICFDMELGLCSKLPNGDGGYLFDLRRHKNNKTIEDVYVVGNIHENKELLKG